MIRGDGNCIDDENWSLLSVMQVSGDLQDKIGPRALLADVRGSLLSVNQGRR